MKIAFLFLIPYLTNEGNCKLSYPIWRWQWVGWLAKKYYRPSQWLAAAVPPLHFAAAPLQRAAGRTGLWRRSRPVGRELRGLGRQVGRQELRGEARLEEQDQAWTSLEDWEWQSKRKHIGCVTNIGHEFNKPPGLLLHRSSKF